MKCMFMPACGIPFDQTIWMILALLLLFLLIVKTGRRIRTEQQSSFERAMKGQAEMISLLKEIRDALKK